MNAALRQTEFTAHMKSKTFLLRTKATLEGRSQFTTNRRFLTFLVCFCPQLQSHNLPYRQETLKIMNVGSSNEAGSEEPTKFIVTRYSKEFSAAKPNIHLTEMA